MRKEMQFETCSETRRATAQPDAYICKAGIFTRSKIRGAGPAIRRYAKCQPLSRQVREFIFLSTQLL